MLLRFLPFSLLILFGFLAQSCDQKTTDPVPSSQCLPQQSYQTGTPYLSQGDRYFYKYDDQGRLVEIPFGRSYAYTPDTTGRYLLSYNAAELISQIQFQEDPPSSSITTYTPTYNSQGQLLKVYINPPGQDTELGFFYDSAGRCIKLEEGVPEHPMSETHYEYFGDTLIIAQSGFYGDSNNPYFASRIDSFSYDPAKENLLHSLQAVFFPDIFAHYVGNNNQVNYYKGYEINFPQILFTPPFRHSKKMLKRWVSVHKVDRVPGNLQTSLRTDYTYEYNAKGWPIKQKATFKNLLPQDLPAFTLEAIIDYSCP